MNAVGGWWDEKLWGCRHFNINMVPCIFWMRIQTWLRKVVAMIATFWGRKRCGCLVALSVPVLEMAILSATSTETESWVLNRKYALQSFLAVIAIELFGKSMRVMCVMRHQNITLRNLGEVIAGSAYLLPGGWSVNYAPPRRHSVYEEYVRRWVLSRSLKHFRQGKMGGWVLFIECYRVPQKLLV